MYLSHFGLNQSPFNITPNPDFFYAGSNRGAILDALIYAVTHGEGIIKVTGEVGSGKTMLCRMLESRLPENVEVIYLVNPSLDREGVIYAIAGELDLATGGKRPDEVIRLLHVDLIKKHITGKQVVLLVEEAQAMPLDTLEEIRLFSNLETAHHKLLQIVLFGQPELDESLSLPRMRQLKERITHSFKVPPLAQATIPEYLMFRMRAAGYHGPDIFTRGALRHMAEASRGVIRRISILADKALLAAFSENTHAVKPRHVKAAIRDSEFSNTGMSSQRLKMVLALLLWSMLAAVCGLNWQLLWPATESPAPVAPVAVIAPKPIEPPPAPPAAPIAAETAAETALAAPESVAEPSAPAAAEASPPAPEGTLPVGLLQQRLKAAKAWLDNDSANRHSIQIMLATADQRVELERFLRKTRSEIGLEQVYVYPTRIGGTLQFGVVYGNYATREEATAAMARLPVRLSSRPYLRTTKGIKEEIERAHDDHLWAQ
jgi:type II secretory pathway predicted ATPase ExeA